MSSEVAQVCDFNSYVIVLVVLEAVSRPLNPKGLRELAKILTNFFLFVLPIASYAIEARDPTLLAGISIFAAAGILIGNDRERCVLGVRRENLFHYGIATGAIMIGMRMP
jgi:hypothetical protein